MSNDVYLLFFINRKLHKISLDETIYLTIHNAIDISGLVIGTVVFHPSVVKHVTTYLTTPLYLFLSSLNLRLCLKTFLHSTIVEL